MNQDIKYSENPSGKCGQSGWFIKTENIKGKWERNITSIEVSKQNTKFQHWFEESKMRLFR